MSNPDLVAGAQAPDHLTPLLSKIKGITPAIEKKDAKAADPLTGVSVLLQTLAGIVATFWRDSYADVVNSIRKELDTLAGLKDRFNKSRTAAMQNIAQAGQQLTAVLDGIYLREEGEAAKRATRIAELPKLIRALKLRMTGNPQATIVVPTWTQKWLLTIAELGGVFALEILVNFNLFQSEGDSLTSLGISTVIMVAGTAFVYFAAKIARQKRDYLTAIAMRNNEFREPKGTIDSQKVDAVSGAVAYVEEPSSDRGWMSILAHSAAIGFAFLVVLVRFYILSGQAPGADWGELLGKSMGTIAIVALWFALYVIERLRQIFDHHRLPEYKALVEELDDLNDDEAASYDAGADEDGPLQEIADAEQAYAETCEDAKRELDEPVREAAASQSRLRVLRAWLEGSTAPVVDAYFEVVHAACAVMFGRAVETVGEDNLPLPNEHDFDLDDADRKEEVSNYLLSERPVPEPDIDREVEEGFQALAPTDDKSLGIIVDLAVHKAERKQKAADTYRDRASAEQNRRKQEESAAADLASRAAAGKSAADAYAARFGRKGGAK